MIKCSMKSPHLFPITHEKCQVSESRQEDNSNIAALITAATFFLVYVSSCFINLLIGGINYTAIYARARRARFRISFPIPFRRDRFRSNRLIWRERPSEIELSAAPWWFCFYSRPIWYMAASRFNSTVETAVKLPVEYRTSTAFWRTDWLHSRR